MITPQRAVVRPRVTVAGASRSILLEDYVANKLHEPAPVAIHLQGVAGSGKKTALAHLAAIFGSDIIARVDLIRSDIKLLPTQHPWVFTSNEFDRQFKHAPKLSPWSDDDVIEYLLAKHPQEVGRIRDVLLTDDQNLCDGNPRLITRVIDEVANDPTLTTTRAALRRILKAEFADPRARQAAYRLIEQFVLSQVLFDKNAFAPFLNDLRPLQRQLAGHRVSALLTADFIADKIRSEEEFVAGSFSHDVIVELATMAKEDSQFLWQIGELQHVRNIPSVLHLVDPFWRPRKRRHRKKLGYQLDRPAYLQSEQLSGAQWRKANVRGINATDADLSDSDISEAKLQSAVLMGADLSRANLSGADLSDVLATKAIFYNADLFYAVLEDGRFAESDFLGADLTHALADGGLFRGADMRKATLHHTRFVEANLKHALLEGADIVDADFTNANLTGACLRLANLESASFTSAKLIEADFEDVVLPHAKFSRAFMNRAIFTGSTMHNADFSRASLTNTGLADIDWEGASLRGADLRGAMFHMGSTRSGLVGSPYPSHGTRTGFYTDDYLDRTHKAPEEIRKANLCGADLQQADIRGVDFYLVDLRGARFDPRHAEQLRRSGAILCQR